jgi:DNA-binding NtrC family response regulator
MFDDTAWAPLQNHPWPGNVRELENVVSRTAVHAEEGVVSEAVVIKALKQGGAAAMSTRVLDVEALVELRDLVNEYAARFGGNDSQGGTYLPVVAGKLDAMIRTREI